MLFFSDTQIVFDFELGESFRYEGSTCAFCEAGAAQNFFPNLKIDEGQIKDADLEHGVIYTMTPNQTLNFIRDWHSVSRFHKMWNWTPEKWAESYLRDIKLVIRKLDGDNCSDGSVFPHMKMRLAEAAKLDYENQDRFVTMTGLHLPEFSWAVEDCLSCRLEGIRSEHEDYVNEIINKNAERNAYYYNKFRVFGNSPKKLAEKYDIMKMSPSSMALELFHSPYPNDCVRTGVTHLRKVLRLYRKKHGKHS